MVVSFTLMMMTMLLPSKKMQHLSVSAIEVCTHNLSSESNFTTHPFSHRRSNYPVVLSEATKRCTLSSSLLSSIYIDDLHGLSITTFTTLQFRLVNVEEKCSFFKGSHIAITTPLITTLFIIQDMVRSF